MKKLINWKKLLKILAVLYLILAVGYEITFNNDKVYDINDIKSGFVSNW